MYNIFIKSKAATHIRKAALWYDTQQKRLGLTFIDEVENAFEALSINPFYSIRYKDVRGFVLKKFPFLILYRVGENKIAVTILAVFHTSQNPEKYPQ